MGTKSLFNITLQNNACSLLLDFVHYRSQDQIMKVRQKRHMAIKISSFLITWIPKRLCSKMFAVLGDFIYKLVA